VPEGLCGHDLERVLAVGQQEHVQLASRSART
jgi:hypothetical protein